MSGLLKEGFSRRVCLYSESLGASRESIYLFANGGFYCPKQQDYGVYDLLEGVELTFYWRGREPERLQWRAAGQSYRSEDGAWLVLSEERLASPLTAGAITCSGKQMGWGRRRRG